MKNKKQEKNLPGMSFKSYDYIFNKLSEWQFPPWPDNPVGCANLLQEQARTMAAYLLPVFKVVLGGLNYSFASILLKRIDNNGAVSKALKTYEDWLLSCPYMGEIESRIRYTAGPEHPKFATGITFNFLRVNYGILKKDTIIKFPRGTKITRYGRDNNHKINYLYGAVAFLAQKAEITGIEKGDAQWALIRFNVDDPPKEKPAKYISAKYTYEIGDNYSTDAIKFTIGPTPEPE